MIKTLTRHGNSYALVIDKPIMELLNIHPDTPLAVSTNGVALLIAPAHESDDAEKLAQLKESMHKKYVSAFKRLAE